MKWFFLIVLLLTPFLAVSSFAQEEAFPLPEPLFVEAIADPDLPPPPIEFLEEVAAEPPPKIWSGGLELGFNGADGNSNLFKIRFAGNVKRDTPENVFLMDFVYGYAKAMGEDTENRALLNARDEIPFPDSPWSVFGSTNIEYDQFKAFDVRLALHAGIGYSWIKTKTTTLKTRIGAGGSWEFGGPDNKFMPEALLGLDFDHAFTDRQKITSSVEVYPDLDEMGEFRLQAKVAYEFLINPDWNLTLKLGVLDRYDSTPEGARPNDLEYFGVLLWSF